MSQKDNNLDLDDKVVKVKVEGQNVLRQETEVKQQASPDAKEINGPKGLEPTRYGDWESKGRCYDF